MSCLIHTKNNCFLWILKLRMILNVLIMSRTRFRVNPHSIVICLNGKELLSPNRWNIWSLSDCNGTRTHNHLVRKWTFNHGWLFVAELSDFGFEPPCSHFWSFNFLLQEIIWLFFRKNKFARQSFTKHLQKFIR